MTDQPNHSPSGPCALTEWEVVDPKNGGVLLINKHDDGQLIAEAEASRDELDGGEFPL
jgi:hypothetical protein